METSARLTPGRDILSQSSPPLSDSPRARGISFARLPLGFAVAFVSLAIMILTEPFLSIVWDEGLHPGPRGQGPRLVSCTRATRRLSPERWQPPVEDLVLPNRIPVPAPQSVEYIRRLAQPGGS